MKKIAIIGAGKVGTSLGCALKRKGHTITSVSCNSLASAQESSRIIGCGRPSINIAETARSGDVIFITVPDDKISGVASKLEESDTLWQEKTIFHCSGLHPAAILKPLQDKGAQAASVHPIQAFPAKKPHLEAFQGIFFGLEGDKKALTLARSLVNDIGGRPLNIHSRHKSLYHAACTISSNFLVVLLDTAVFLFKEAGIDERQAAEALYLLTAGTIENIKNLGIGSALTGPLVRGDEETLRKHLAALETYPGIKELYKRLARQSLHMPQVKKALTGEKIKTLSQVLE